MVELNENELSRVITDAVVHLPRHLTAPGLDDVVYCQGLGADLRSRGLRIDRQEIPPGVYRGVKTTRPTTIDLIVNERVIVLCKVAKAVTPVMEAQALAQLRMTGMKMALIVLFGDRLTRRSVYRVIDPTDGASA